MKNIRFIIALYALTLVSCSNEIEVETPVFEITTASNTYKAGETVIFNIEGYADYITFYSGEIGANYDYRERTQIEGAKPKLAFVSTVKYGKPADSLRLLISGNFNGTVTKEGIYKAKWIDITDRAVISTGTDVSSGVIDLSDFIEKPLVNIAFKYIGVGSPTASQKSCWIKEFELKTLDSKGLEYPLIPTLNEAGWVQCNILGENRKWTISGSQLFIGANANEDSNEDWVITKSISLASLKPDKGTPIKSLSGPIKEWSHIYAEPGIYKVVFRAANSNIYGNREVLKEITLNIVPEN